jgi:hypothetical protein
MQSRLLLNIMLLALVIALTMIVYNSSDKDADKVTPLTTLTPSAINDIRIHHNHHETVLHKQDGDWKITQPINIKANDFRINTLLKLLTTTSQADYAIDGLDLAKYGLEQPATTIRFNDTKIAFGISNPVNGLRYVRVGDRMHLIDDSFYPLLSSQTGALVARELLPQDADIAKLVLPKSTLSRNPNGSWSSNKNVDTDAIRQTLSNWKHTQAFGVHNYMQRKMLAKIEVYLGNQPEPLRFVVTDTDPWLIIARPDLDLEYHFQLEDYDGLLRPGASEQQIPADSPEVMNREIVKSTGDTTE